MYCKYDYQQYTIISVEIILHLCNFNPFPHTFRSSNSPTYPILYSKIKLQLIIQISNIHPLFNLFLISSILLLISFALSSPRSSSLLPATIGGGVGTIDRSYCRFAGGSSNLIFNLFILS